MGLFDKWTKKTQEEQLAAAGTAVVAEEKEKEQKTAAKSEKTTTKKTPSKNVTKKATADAPVEAKMADEAMLARMGTGVNPRDILLRAHITEKASVQESSRVYTFVVAQFANKPMVAEAVYRMFGYKPVAVHILTHPGKVVRFGRTMGKRSATKIARVTMKEGEVLSIHKGV